MKLSNTTYYVVSCNTPDILRLYIGDIWSQFGVIDQSRYSQARHTNRFFIGTRISPGMSYFEGGMVFPIRHCWVFFMPQSRMMNITLFPSSQFTVSLLEVYLASSFLQKLQVRAHFPAECLRSKLEDADETDIFVFWQTKTRSCISDGVVVSRRESVQSCHLYAGGLVFCQRMAALNES